MTKTKTVEPNLKHLRFRKALEGAIAQGGMDLPAEELLAITAHFLGQLVAMQDQRKYTSEMVMDLVLKNMEVGNSEVIQQLTNETGGNA